MNLNKISTAHANALKAIARKCNSEMVDTIELKAKELKLMGLSMQAAKAAAYQMSVTKIIDKHYATAATMLPGLSRLQFIWYIGKHVNDRFGREDDEEVRREEEKEWTSQ